MSRLPWLTLVWLHALLVAVLIVTFYVVSGTGPETDANIGAGIVGLLLLGLGLPWSIPVWIIEPDVYERWSPVIRGLVSFGPAVLNVVIHAAIVSVLGRRRR